MSLEKEFDFYKNKIRDNIECEECVSIHLMIPKSILAKIETMAELYDTEITEAIIKVIYSSKLWLVPVDMYQEGEERDEFDELFIGNIALIDTDYIKEIKEKEEE